MSKSKDLFDETTMSFGDHLEELRICLWKALIGLVVGVIGGLFVAPFLLRTIQVPIKGKLDEFYQEEFKKSEKESQNADPAQKPVEMLFTLDADQVRAFIEELRRNGAQVAELPEGDFTINFRGNLAEIPPELKGPSSAYNPLAKPFGSGPMEPFMMYLKVSLIAGLVFSSPWVFYQIWSFVAAGLYPHEKKYVHFFLPFSLGLFLGGVFFCFFVVLPVILDYLFTFNSWLGITPFIRISEWVSFAVMLPVMFGIGFQLPLVMLFLERIGIFTVADYRSKRRIAILVIAIASMMLTPPDPGSMLMLMFPMIGLYEGGIWLVAALRRRSPFEGKAAVP
jgi:sec-independent protein translocase protein TatC